MDFFVGGRYLSATGNTVRVIERVYGDDIYWRDSVGPGRCSTETFKRWVGSLCPDSPIPLQNPKRVKRVPIATIEIVRKELVAIQNVRISIAEIMIEAADSEHQAMIRSSLWFLGSTLERLEQEIRPDWGYGNRLRRITRIDSGAASAKQLISVLLELLDMLPEASLESPVTRLRAVLSDGLPPLVRIRSALKSCLNP